jgi:hypothetical protein
MKRPLLMIAFLTLACAATLAPIRSTPPILLSDSDGTDWKCSRSALILTTCAPNRDVRLTSDSVAKVVLPQVSKIPRAVGAVFV